MIDFRKRQKLKIGHVVKTSNSKQEDSPVIVIKGFTFGIFVLIDHVKDYCKDRDPHRIQ